MDPWERENVIIGVMGTAGSENVANIEKHVGPTTFIDKNSPAPLREKVYPRYITVDMAFSSPFLAFTCGDNTFAHRVEDGSIVQRLLTNIDKGTYPTLYYDNEGQCYLKIGVYDINASYIHFRPYEERRESLLRRLSRMIANSHTTTALHPSVLATVLRFLDIETHEMAME